MNGKINQSINKNYWACQFSIQPDDRRRTDRRDWKGDVRVARGGEGICTENWQRNAAFFYLYVRCSPEKILNQVKRDKLEK